MSLEIPSKQDFDELKEDQRILKEGILTLLSILGEPILDVKDIAAREGMAAGSLYMHRYRHYLPNFGVSDFADGRVRWRFQTYLDWIAKPIEDRQKQWYSMPAKEREKIVMKKKMA